MASGSTSLETALNEALRVAGPGREQVAVLRMYRRIGLDALSEIPAEKLSPDIGVLHTIVSASELYAYATFMVGYGSKQITFTEESVGDVVEFLCWCQAFFSHLAFVAPDLSPSIRSEIVVQQHAQTCSIDLAGIIAKLQGRGNVEAPKRSEGIDQTESGMMASISMSTFVTLARSLLAIVFAWLDDTACEQFMASFHADFEELQDLRLLALEGAVAVPVVAPFETELPQGAQ